MTKVVLTKQQAKDIKDIMKYNGKPRLIHEKVKGGWRAYWTSLNELSNDDFAAALYHGYEVEMTEDEKLTEKIRSEFKDITSDTRSEWDRGYDSGWESGVGFALKELGKGNIAKEVFKK